ncbi:hypothetical protein GCM10011504_22220 [Siccirubricoccus deserti]|uniref:Uncharacterized protein n=1 Tax=Siccirubricoccus deserti TaxID=2013562 RepID=A0A9X0UCT2_9PROT|nr:DUF4286 family protein [Siccirubricoccus deserti]MBC4015639.1 hypothetical protein [Siccirubricoccus deserti]GGC43367.1 hypothetical protein GCM10011504_22220 [Siccirubricoccus deserti]
MARKGFLLVFMHPPPAFEEEFNAWYDTEHIPERLAVPGILTGLRFMHASGGTPRYLAMYDLEHASVMDSPAYLRVAHDNSSPWTKRVTARARVQRFTGEQVYPGDAVTTRSGRVLVLRFRGLARGGVDAVVAGICAAYEGLPEVRQVRALVHDAGAAGLDVLGFVEAAAPLPERVDVAAFGPAASALDLVGSYAAF